MFHTKKYLMNASIIVTFCGQSAWADSSTKEFGCSIQKICNAGAVVSCEASGNGARCDILSDGVSCQYYEAGELQVDTRLCPPLRGPSDEYSSHSFESNAVSDAEAIIRRPDGFYDVKCNDGSRERVDRAALDAGDICKGGNSSGRFQISCEGFGNNYYPSRSSDGYRFGALVTSSDCRAIAEVSVNHVTCASMMPGSFHVSRISDGARLGERGQLNDCLQAALLNRQGVTCVPYSTGWRLIDVKNEKTMGTTNSAQGCLTALRFAREGVAWTTVAVSGL